MHPKQFLFLIMQDSDSKNELIMANGSHSYVLKYLFKVGIAE